MFKKDYKYNIGYNIQGYHDCENHGCDDEGICRCYTITDVEIKNVDVLAISYSIFSEIFNTKSTQYKRDNKLNQILYGFNQEIDLYCIDRILRISKIWENDNWNTSWGPNYYGDELDNIEMSDKLYANLISKISHLISLTNLKDKIQYVLELEYGYLLDKIKDKSYEVVEIDKSKIIFGQEDYKKKIDILNYYSDIKYDLIRGVCLFKNDEFRVIDGYHRLLSTKKEKVKIISIYENK